MSFKYSIILASVFLIILLSELSNAQERKCVDGKRYNDGCNNCWCTMGNVACTLMACQAMGPDGELIPITPIPPPEEFWEPAE